MNLPPEEEPTSPEKSLQLFTRLLVLVSLGFIGLGFLLGGVDFALGVLVGSSLMVLNFLWTRRAVTNAMEAEKPRASVGIAYALKLGVTGVLIYSAIFIFGIHPVGLLVGLSSLVITSVVFAVMQYGK